MRDWVLDTGILQPLTRIYNFIESGSDLTLQQKEHIKLELQDLIKLVEVK